MLPALLEWNSTRRRRAPHDLHKVHVEINSYSTFAPRSYRSSGREDVNCLRLGLKCDSDHINIWRGYLPGFVSNMAIRDLAGALDYGWKREDE
jgi:hypothetical protein